MKKNLIVLASAAALFLASPLLFAQRGAGGAHAGGMGLGAPGGMPGSHGPMGSPMGPGPRESMGSPSARPASNRTTIRQKPTVNDLLAQNSNLSSQLEKLTGATDLSSLQSQAAGFKNLGQFVAAAHVAKNLDIPFSDLQKQLASNKGNLGKAIHTLKPDANSKKEIKQAKKQAKKDLKKSKG